MNIRWTDIYVEVIFNPTKSYERSASWVMEMYKYVIEWPYKRDFHCYTFDFGVDCH